jgi:hypothetical protein
LAAGGVEETAHGELYTIAGRAMTSPDSMSQPRDPFHPALVRRPPEYPLFTDVPRLPKPHP